MRPRWRGPRHIPEVHIDVPIVGEFELFGRTEVAEAEVRDLAKNIWQISAYTMRSLAREEASGAVPGGERRQMVASLGAVIAQGCSGSW